MEKILKTWLFHYFRMLSGMIFKTPTIRLSAVLVLLAATLLLLADLFAFTRSFLGLLAFMTFSSFLCYYFVIRRTLPQLDPTAVIPERVQKAFNILQEGVMILDEKEQIVMTNTSFSVLFGKSPTEMVGLKGSELGWLDFQNQRQIHQLPWIKTMQDGKERRGASLNLRDHHGKMIKLAVNTSTVNNNAEKVRGILVTFDDITQLEEKNSKLSDMLDRLQAAHSDIRTKNQELEILANCDPLTFCLNRRSLAKQFEALFAQAIAVQGHLSCLMVDIDFFKSVNDNYGHATGDKVIKAIADVLKTSTRDNDLVGRYGGEEFCVVLPEIESDTAANIAERIRQGIERRVLSGVKITVSIGVCSLESNANKPDELLNLADKALYAAKRSGRNRVVRWGKDLTSLEELESGAEPEIQTPSPRTGNAPPVDLDMVQLQNRVTELEGLLEQRVTALQRYQMFDIHSGFPTRSLFEHRIAHEIARAKRKDHLVAIMSMTIETIKQVQQSLGIRAALKLVKSCGQRVNDVVRENIDVVSLIENAKDMSTVSLVNQAEFGIMISDITQVDHVTFIMKRIIRSFEKPFHLNGNEIYISPYFGVSIFPHDGRTVEELYNKATNACSFAEKQNGKDR